MANNCFVEKMESVIENDNLKRFNSFRVYFPDGVEHTRYVLVTPNQTLNIDFYSNKKIYNVNAVPSKHGNVSATSTGAPLYPDNEVSGLVYIDTLPLDKISKVAKGSGVEDKSFVDIDDFVYSNIKQLELAKNTYENREITCLGYMPELTSFVSSRSKYSGSIESVVEKTVENYPAKEKSLVINLYAQADFGGTVTFHGSALTISLYIEFNGDGTANVYNNADHSTVIASYNGTTWTYA